MKTTRILATLVVLLAAAAAAQAQTNLTATSTVNVRSGPSTGYAIIGQVPQGHTYVGLTKSGDWWKIYYNGGTGWTYGPYYTSPSGTTGVKVTVDVLNVRSGPSTGYSIKGQIYMGQIYFWTQYEGLNGWYKIYWGGGIGYVYGSYVTKVSLLGGSSSPPPPSTTTNLSMTFYYQVTNYFCGPTSAQMIILYISGKYYSQYTIASYCGTSPSYGTSNTMVKQAINYYSPSSYQQVGYDGQRLRNNIGSSRPCNVNMQCHYLAYWGYSYAMHHSPVKGYTSGGFYIHDSWMGPDKWASSTELYNAVVYHYNLTAVRY
jgi:uncharacterized protein YraI